MCVFIFSCEVVLRTIVATLDVRRLLLLDAYYWVDVLSIVPFYNSLITDATQPPCGPAAGPRIDTI